MVYNMPSTFLAYFVRLGVGKMTGDMTR